MEAWLIYKLEQERKAREKRDAERPQLPIPTKETPLKV